MGAKGEDIRGRINGRRERGDRLQAGELLFTLQPEEAFSGLDPLSSNPSL